MDRSARRTIQVSKTFSDSLLSSLRLHFSSCDANNDGLLDEKEFLSFLVQAVGYKAETTVQESKELITLITRKTVEPIACNFFQIIQNFELLKAGVIGALSISTMYLFQFRKPTKPKGRIATFLSVPQNLTSPILAIRVIMFARMFAVT
jgi:hypothetical protein